MNSHLAPSPDAIGKGSGVSHLPLELPFVAGQFSFVAERTRRIPIQSGLRGARQSKGVGARCPAFSLCLDRVLTGPARTVALALAQHRLAQAHKVRRDLKTLIVHDEFKRLLE